MTLVGATPILLRVSSFGSPALRVAVWVSSPQPPWGFTLVGRPTLVLWWLGPAGFVRRWMAEGGNARRLGRVASAVAVSVAFSMLLAIIVALLVFGRNSATGGDSASFLLLEGAVQKTFNLRGCRQYVGLLSLSLAWWCLGLYRFGRLLASGAWRYSSRLVGEESELPRVGCVEAWQRWCAAALLVCQCLGVGVVEFLWSSTSRHGSRSCSSLVLSSATMTLNRLYVWGCHCLGCLWGTFADFSVVRSV
jgi:hypothetical protein